MKSSLALIAIAVAFLGTGVAADPVYKNVDAAAAKALVDKAGGDKAKLTVLDVRTDEEFAAGHIAGAVQIDYLGDEFAKKLAKLDRDQAYLVHCRSGGRSKGALDAMKKLGFKVVHHLDGGMQAWVAAGGEVVKKK